MTGRLFSTRAGTLPGLSMTDYLIVDAIRLADLQHQDTTAQTPAEAKTLAEAMAKQYGVAVTILAPVGVVEAGLESRWTQALPGADVVPFGWMGVTP